MLGNKGLMKAFHSADGGGSLPILGDNNESIDVTIVANEADANKVENSITVNNNTGNVEAYKIDKSKTLDEGTKDKLDAAKKK